MTDARWHHAQTLAAGQVAEFKVWAELVRQSMGGLHVFLPLRDMGIDGVLHRLSDGAYVAVQVKGRMSLTPAGQVHHGHGEQPWRRCGDDRRHPDRRRAVGRDGSRRR